MYGYLGEGYSWNEQQGDLDDAEGEPSSDLYDQSDEDTAAVRVVAYRYVSNPRSGFK
jgi:hypothetical protein